MIRTKKSLSLLILVLTGPALAAWASPEEDREQSLELYPGQFPKLRLENYVYGALNFSADARKQYDQIMDLPPFGDAIEQGKAMSEAPFANGKFYASCFPEDGRSRRGCKGGPIWDVLATYLRNKKTVAPRQ